MCTYLVIYMCGNIWIMLWYFFVSKQLLYIYICFETQSGEFIKMEISGVLRIIYICISQYQWFICKCYPNTDLELGGNNLHNCLVDYEVHTWRCSRLKDPVYFLSTLSTYIFYMMRVTWCWNKFRSGTSILYKFIICVQLCKSNPYAGNKYQSFPCFWQ